jgi:hypothetical protein
MSNRSHVEIALESEEALDAFLRSWNDGSLPREAWTHAAHVLVAGSLVRGRAPLDALRDLRAGILQFNSAKGILSTPDSGYHETVTRFWALKVGEFLAGPAGNGPRLEALRRLVAEFGVKRNWYRDYYSFDVVGSREARARWVAPDLRDIGPAPGGSSKD